MIIFNHTSKHVRKVLGQILDPKEFLDNSESVSSVDTRTNRETSMVNKIS